jgi:hypothetical protein
MKRARLRVQDFGMIEMQLKSLTPSYFLDAHSYMLQGYAYMNPDFAFGCKHTYSMRFRRP